MENEQYEPTNAQLAAQIADLKTIVTALAAHLSLDPVLALVIPAPDSDLNSEWGNPTIRKTPAKWSGEVVEGRQMSDLHPSTLRALAKHFASLADWHDREKHVDDKGRPKSFYSRKDAGRALGWALRLEARGGRAPARPQHREESYAPPQAPAEEPATSDDDIPFLTAANKGRGGGAVDLTAENTGFRKNRPRPPCASPY